MKIIRERHREHHTEYSLDYKYIDVDGWAGFSFDCDENGNPTVHEEGLKNYQECLAGTNGTVFEGIKKNVHSWIEPAVGICDVCGREVQLIGDYSAATECECGQWYNLSGQTLMPPEMWEENMDYNE